MSRRLLTGNAIEIPEGTEVKTLYEVNWHYSNDVLVRISVTPIKVLREGILPGCSAVSITAVDKDGHQFQGCPQDYFETEEAAWAQTKIELQETIASEERDVEEAQRRIKGLRSVLSAIQVDESAPDVSALVGALEWLRGAINATPENDKVQAGIWISSEHPRIKQIDAILAAYRIQQPKGENK